MRGLQAHFCLHINRFRTNTYRVYDYDRRDEEGNLRELHLEKAIEVTTVPHQASASSPTVETKGDVTITTFVNSASHP